MKKYLLHLSISVLAFHSFVQAQQVDDIIREANDFYKQGEYDLAKKAYEDALAKDSSNVIAKFNLANTIYRLGKTEDAVKSFDELAFKGRDADSKAKSYYNKGVALTNQKKLEESIDAYKNALRQDPNDKEARENLQKALLELKKKTPPPPKKEDQKKKQQQNKQQQSKMNQKEAEQKLKLLEQKEKELQQRLQQQKSKTGSGGKKDW